jgi:hypothetical protein
MGSHIAVAAAAAAAAVGDAVGDAAIVVGVDAALYYMLVRTSNMAKL